MSLILCYFIAFSTGIVIASAFVALINSVGIVRNIIVRYGTKKYQYVYLTFILLGCLFASMLSFYPNATLMLPTLGKVICVIIGIFYGIFIGYLALALAEVFDVIPIVNNRMGFRFSIKLLIIAVAIGKLFGAALYFIVPGFYVY